MDRELTPTGAPLRERLAQLQADLDVLRPQLIEAEAQLAERLAAISAFEFTLRARLGRLSRRLDDIQREIDELRRQMRKRQADWLDVEESGPRGASGAWRYAEEPAAASGSYRYRDQAAEAPAAALEENQQARLKLLYRQLARRFHPDLALDEADRDYRTGLMMAINAAYTAGDLAELERLALEPDSAAAPRTDEALVEALEREVERCRRRLDEIRNELATLERHPNTRLMRRVEKAAAEGHDLLAEMARDLRRQVSEKMVERDVLETQLEEMEEEGGFDDSDEELPDIVFNLGLEEPEGEGFLSSFDEWGRRQRDRLTDEWDNRREEDDILDDSD